VVRRAKPPESADARRRRPGGRNAEVRGAVLRATRELLASEGFGAVTLPAIARRAGVNKTTLYRSWGSPVALVHEALAELEALALPEIDTGRFEDDLAAFAASRLRLIREPHAAGILRAVIGAESPDPALYDWIEAFWRPRQKEWRSPIERAIERGELAPSARDVPLVELVAGPLLLARLATRRRVTPAEVRAVARLVAAGVRALHPPARSRRAPGRAGTARRR
jgi:AcrR family transcriptional regulator